MRLERHDHRDWGLFGLVLLVYGLGLSPFIHAELQHRGHEALDAADEAWASHEVPASAGHERNLPAPESPHEDGVEHLTVLAQAATPPPCAPEPIGAFAWLIWGEERQQLGGRLPPPGMPQGP